MKLIALLFASMLVMPLVACSNDPASYATYQACFDDQTNNAHLAHSDAITKCCLDHPIMGVSPACGTNNPDCINYLTANLDQTSASTGEVIAGCADYVMQLTM